MKLKFIPEVQINLKLQGVEFILQDLVKYKVTTNSFLSYTKTLDIDTSKKLSFFFNKKKNYRDFLKNFLDIQDALNNGFILELEIAALGYKILKHIYKSIIYLRLGYSHDIYYYPRKGIFFFMKKKKVIIFGFNKYHVYQTATEIRNFRIPNIYKGTGIRYKYENIKLKVGKVR